MASNVQERLAALERYAADRGLAHQLIREQQEEAGAWLAEHYEYDLVGELPGGEHGTLQVMVGRGRWRERDGDIGTASVSGAIPESIPYIPTLICIEEENPLGARDVEVVIFNRFPDSRQLRDVVLESVALERRFLIKVTPAQDENWIRQLFPPTFIDWLAEHAPPTLVVALDRGTLHLHIPQTSGATPEEEDLDQLCQVYSHVAGRIREECAEEIGGLRAGRPLHEQRAVAAAEAHHPAGAVARRVPLAVFAMLVVTGFCFLALALTPDAIFTASGYDLTWIRLPASLVIGALCAVYVLQGPSRAALELQDLRLADEGFAAQYGRARGLELEDTAAFHARVLGVPLPAAASYALTGALPGGLNGTVALCTDRIRPREPVNWNVVVVPGRTEPDPLPEDIFAAAGGGHVAIWSRGAKRPYPRELDDLCQTAAELVA